MYQEPSQAKQHSLDKCAMVNTRHGSSTVVGRQHRVDWLGSREEELVTWAFLIWLKFNQFRDRTKVSFHEVVPSLRFSLCVKNSAIPSGFFFFLIHRMSVLGLRVPATYSGFWRCFKRWRACIQVALQAQESRHSATHRSIWQTRRSFKTWEKDWFPLSHILWVSRPIVGVLPSYIGFDILSRQGLFWLMI